MDVANIWQYIAEINNLKIGQWRKVYEICKDFCKGWSFHPVSLSDLADFMQY